MAAMLVILWSYCSVRFANEGQFALTALTQLNQLFFVALYLILFDARLLSQDTVLQIAWPDLAALSAVLENAIAGHAWSILLILCSPFMMFKQWAHFLQLVDASRRLAKYDARERETMRGKTV